MSLGSMCPFGLNCFVECLSKGNHERLKGVKFYGLGMFFFPALSELRRDNLRGLGGRRVPRGAIPVVRVGFR